MNSKKKPAKKAPKITPDKPAKMTPEPAAQEAAEPIIDAAEQSEPVNETVEESPEAAGPPELEEQQTTQGAETAAPDPSTQDEANEMPVVGQTLTRTYKGKQVKVDVTEEGFVYEGKTYTSLSALAKEITGYQSINGRAFFHVGKSPNRPRGNRLAAKIKKVDTLIGKLRVAVQEAEEAVLRGREELAESEAKRAELAQQAAQTGTEPE